MASEIRNVQIQPDGCTEIKLMADFIQRVKNFMGTGIIAAVLDTKIPHAAIGTADKMLFDGKEYEMLLNASSIMPQGGKTENKN